MKAVRTYTLTATLLVAFFCLGHLMDGPSDMQAEEDTAAALRDAQMVAQGAKHD